MIRRFLDNLNAQHGAPREQAREITSTILMHAIPLALRPASSLPLLLLRGGASPSTAELPLLLLRGGALPPTTFEMNAATQDFIMQATLYIGTLMSALSGCISAGTKQMDLFGCVVVGSLTAIGGGTLRDVMRDRPPFWLAYTAHLHCACGSRSRALSRGRGS